VQVRGGRNGRSPGKRREEKVRLQVVRKEPKLVGKRGQVHERKEKKRGRNRVGYTQGKDQGPVEGHSVFCKECNPLRPPSARGVSLSVLYGTAFRLEGVGSQVNEVNTGVPILNRIPYDLEP